MTVDLGDDGAFVESLLEVLRRWNSLLEFEVNSIGEILLVLFAFVAAINSRDHTNAFDGNVLFFEEP